MLAIINRTMRLEGEAVLRNGKPIKQVPGANKASYRKVHICRLNGHKITWKLSRLKLYLATGEMPAIVDHASGETRDDSLANLRAASAEQNNWNRRPNRNKLDGLPRAVFRNGRGKYYAAPKHRGRAQRTRSFETVAEAVAARNAIEKPLRGQFHRPRRKSVRTSTAARPRRSSPFARAPKVRTSSPR